MHLAHGRRKKQRLPIKRCTLRFFRSVAISQNAANTTGRLSGAGGGGRCNIAPPSSPQLPSYVPPPSPTCTTSRIISSRREMNNGEKHFFGIGKRKKELQPLTQPLAQKRRTTQQGRRCEKTGRKNQSAGLIIQLMCN